MAEILPIRCKTLNNQPLSFVRNDFWCSQMDTNCASYVYIRFQQFAADISKKKIIIYLEYLNVSTKSGDVLVLSSLLTCILYLVEKYLMISYAIYYRRQYFAWFYIETGIHHSFDSNFRFPCILFWTWTVLCKKKVRIKIKILPIYDYICCL